MSYYGYTDIYKILGCERLHKKTKGEAFVVMGFQRSGTSLLSQLVNACGVFFGPEDELKQPSITNPDGFFEHKKVSALSWEYFREVGYKNNIDYDANLHTKNIWQKLSRLVTVRRIHSVLYRLSIRQEKWGIKNFPLFYYVWKDYLPKHKIIAIYRDPYASTHSFLNIFWPSKFTYEYGLSLWVQAQKDMLYHLSQTESLLIRYEDLIDDTKNTRITQRLVEFIGSGDAQKIRGMIKPSLNRMDKKVLRLREWYPSHTEINETIKFLDTIKI